MEEKQLEEIVTFTVTANDVGKRLDKYLAEKLPDFSRSKLHHQIVEGDVLVNDCLSKPSYRVKLHDRIEIELPELVTTELIPENLPLDILYEDEALLVINKPAGQVVHPGAGVQQGTIANALAWYLSREISGFESTIRPGLVHRLDKDTSGVMVIAKTEAALSSLCEQFAARAVKKHYLALVYGHPQKQGRIELPIGRHPVVRTKMAIVPTGRPALTIYKVLCSYDEFSLLEVEIKTGRTHQIRVHLSYEKHPVVGDTTYGKGYESRLSEPARKAVNKLQRHLLHAHRLSFTHPITGKQLIFTAKLAEDFAAFLQQLDPEYSP